MSNFIHSLTLLIVFASCLVANGQRSTSTLSTTAGTASSSRSDSATSSSLSSSISTSITSTLNTVTSSTTSTAASGSQTPVVTLVIPPLIQCEYAIFSFTAPPVQKGCGLFVTGSSTFLETFTLGAEYDPYINGTFSWLVDLPVGLAVNAMLYVYINGTQYSATSPQALVGAGSSSACLAKNTGQNTQSIVSLASSLNPLFTYTSTTWAPSQTKSVSDTRTSSGANIPAIVGGAVGGVGFIALILAVFLFLKARHETQKNKRGEGSFGGSSYHRRRRSLLSKTTLGPESTVGVPSEIMGYPLSQSPMSSQMLSPVTADAPWSSPNTAQSAWTSQDPPSPSWIQPAISPLRTAPDGMLPEPMDYVPPSPSATRHTGASVPNSPVIEPPVDPFRMADRP